MVATRRQVQAEPGIDLLPEQDPGLILKKPVRRATAKSTNTKPEAKTRTTREKKVEVEAEPEVEVSEAEAPTTRQKAGRPKKAASQPAPAQVQDELTLNVKPAKATKAGSIRGKRGAAVVEEVTDAPAVEEPKATRSSKAGTVRNKKAAPLVEETSAADDKTSTTVNKNASVRGRKAKAAVAIEPPTLPAREAIKPARQTRGAASKPQPLSPKKITQVLKPPARNTRNANQKTAAKAVPKKAPTTARSTRKRTVSDENADVPDFDTATDDFEEDVIMLASTPKKTSTQRAQKKDKRNLTIESDVSMSSRPTTPGDSPAQSLNTVEEQENTQEDDEATAEADSDVENDSDGSEDELCGPKTPMRRSSPTTQARYQSSVQRTIRKYEDEMRSQTPARRYAILGSQRGTPQTQKPYCKPIPPTSVVRPMTVSRATGEAYVFKDLRDGAPSPRESYDALAEQDEVSFLPDEDIISSDATPCPEDPISFAQPSEIAMETSRKISAAASLVVEDEEDFVVPAAVQKYSDDPDDTVIIHGAEEDNEAGASEEVSSFHTEDTVLIDRHEWVEPSDAHMDEDTTSEEGSVIMHDDEGEALAQSKLPTPEKPAENAPIFVNFDEHMADVRTTLEDNAGTFDLTPTHDMPDENGVATVAGTEMRVVEERFDPQAASRRQTVNFNEFIDIAALSEPTAVLSINEDKVESVGGELSIKLMEVANVPDESQHHPKDAVPNQIDLSFDNESVAEVMVLDAAPTPIAPTPNANNIDPGEVVPEPIVPHYALPTISFDARRKSLPAFSQRTPVKAGARPNTSDGSSVPRNPFANVSWTGPRAGFGIVTPSKAARPSTSHGTPICAKFDTPSKSRKSTEAATTPVRTPGERYPVLSSRQNYIGHANTVAPPARFGTPSKKSPNRRQTFHKAAPGALTAKPVQSLTATLVASAAATPKERYPALKPRENYEDHAKTVSGPVRFQNPSEKSPKRRQTFHKATTGEIETQTPKVEASTPNRSVAETPQTTPIERYPRLRPRPDNEQHAKTVAGPVRFQTPQKIPLKRPATGTKSDSLRKAVLFANSPVSSHTPMKTPLKAPGMTPSQAPMTPHPAAPLRGVVALVEIFTLEGASASAPFVALLHRLGAKTTRSWNDRITHVVFKDGSPLTLQRVRLNNKEFEETGTGSFMHCVNSRWVTDCDTEGARVEESGEAYIVDVAEIPRGGKRRRKSMEPAALLNLGGNIVRDRKSSLGRNRSSLSRSSWKVDSPAKKVEQTVTATPEIDIAGKENSEDEQGSPATPAWIAAPGQLVQQTAPMKRVRRLELTGRDESKNRRLTYWSGAA